MKNVKYGLFFVVAAIGAYNAIVINSHSEISDTRFVKRLDEALGVVTPGREVAAIEMPKRTWKKLTQKSFVNTAVVNSEVKSENHNVESAVTENLNLTLSDVVNVKRFKKGLNPSQFTGALVTNEGVIESLTVSLPKGQGFTVTNSEMKGNVFQFDMDGSQYSGLVYQIDQDSYMVSISNGPLEGTRFRFTNERIAQVDSGEIVPVGTFGGSVDATELIDVATADMANATFQF